MLISQLAQAFTRQWDAMRPTGYKPLLIAFVLGLSLTACQVGFSLTEMTPAILAARLASDNPPVLLDVRSPQEYAAGHIPGAINIPYREVPHRLDELAAFKTDEIVVYCEVGVRAGIAELALEKAGYQRIVQLEGDMRAWRDSGGPIATVAPEITP
ncbi:MAG: rhodanese-like domain-containing protein [Cyanobacteria bacterium P01_H01_bin.58]